MVIADADDGRKLVPILLSWFFAGRHARPTRKREHEEGPRDDYDDGERRIEEKVLYAYLHALGWEVMASKDGRDTPAKIHRCRTTMMLSP